MNTLQIGANLQKRGYTYKTSLNSVADGHVEFKMVFIMLSSLSLILFLYSENEYSKYLIN